jgi:hypothetical protein
VLDVALDITVSGDLCDATIGLAHANHQVMLFDVSGGFSGIPDCEAGQRSLTINRKTGQFKEKLDGFVGKPAAGEWKLVVSNEGSARSKTGITLEQWRLVLSLRAAGSTASIGSM